VKVIEKKNLAADYSGTEGGQPSVPNSARCADWNGVLHLLMPALVLTLAFFLRVYRLPLVPFGWHPDESVKGIMAREVLAGKAFPVFFSAFTGRDALYVYLEAAAFALFGEGMLAGRLLSAFIGVLTVAMTYAVGRAMFNRRVGWLGAGFMAVSLWHLIASRNGYRAVIQPLVQLPVMWLLFRAWRVRTKTRRSRVWLFVAAGFFLGLTQYTYTAARIFPVLALAVVLLALVLVRAAARQWRSLLLMFLVAAAVVSPLAVYFLRHPIDFYGRAEQISIFAPQFSSGDPWGRLWRSVVETARMFTVWGDPNYRFNLAGRPIFGPFDGVLFYLGLLYCLLFAVWSVGQIGNLTYRRRWLAYATLLLWLLIMLVPMMLSAESLPYYQRAIGALPAVYFFPALFLDALLGMMEERTPDHVLWVARIFGIAIAALLLFSLTRQVYTEYFVGWHAAPQNDDDRRVAMVYVADYLKRVEPVDELYLSSEYGEHPTLAFLAPERYDGIHWFDARQSLPLPPQGTTATYLLMVENPPQPALLARVPDLRRVDTGYDRFGRPVFEVYRWESGAFPTPADRSPGIASWERTFEPGDPHGLRRPVDLPVNFGDVMLFLGHDRSESEVAPGETLEVLLYWQLLQRPELHYSIFVHLLDGESRIVGEFDANSYGTKYWREDGGEMLLGYYPLRVSPDVPPGEYQLEIGVYHQPTGERLPIYDQSGEMVADRLLLRPVQVR
jgi:4-amino-4-deoxy-L-arabinose transferase-like glycosyltransferase